MRAKVESSAPKVEAFHGNVEQNALKVERGFLIRQFRGECRTDVS